MKVVKKDDRKEDFDREKIKRGIINAAKRAELSEDRVNEIADKIAAKIEEDMKERDEAMSKDIRDKVLEELDREEKKVADEFRSFRKE
jgi:transcriptional repressor NrdR